MANGPPNSSSPIVPIRRKESILVVDDNPDVVLLFRDLLTKKGYYADGAGSAEDALALLALRPPDLILVDAIMPGKSGFDLCREIKDNPSTRLIPVVILTGLTGREDKLHGIEAGADEFLSKPIFQEELFAVVRQQLKKRGWLYEHLYRGKGALPRPSTRPGGVDYDAFICHASEDKTFVRPLADRLISAGAQVWYDEFSLKMGDSLRRSIENGLAQSRYGIIILSPHFFRKEWPKKELDTLVSKEQTEERLILPIWLDLTFEDVRQFAPMLADRVAARSQEGIEAIVQKVVAVIRPDLLR
jgi:CheY-like chemotaxis protein